MSINFGWWDHFERLPEAPLDQQYRERIELVQLADSLGINGYHVAEHHFSDLDLAPSPLLYLASLAERTEHIRLGTLVLCLPLYHPARLLQELCMVDQLSHGRLDPGIGRGIRQIDHEWLGSDFSDTKVRFNETYELLRQGLETGHLNFQGKYFSYDNIPVLFDSYQKPMRFWYAGNYRFAAENGMSCIGQGGRADYDEYWKIFNEGRQSKDPRFGGATPRVGSTRHLVVAENDEQAKEIARRAWRAHADNFWSTPVHFDGKMLPKASIPFHGGDDADEMMAAGALLAGSPGTVRDSLLQIVEEAGPGYNYLVNAFQWGDMTHAESRTSMELFAAHVMPAIREAHSAVEAPAIS